MKDRKLVPLILGLALLLFFVLMAAKPALFSDYDPKEMFPQWLPASTEHPLGTNALGYDIFTELVHGARQTLLIGLFSSVLTLLLGTLIGTFSTAKGAVGRLFNGLINIFVLLPRLVALIVLSGFFGGSTLNLILLIAAFEWVGIARNVRAAVMHLNEQPFMENCTVLGYSKLHTVIFHVIPNLSDVLLSRFLLGVNNCIMMESTLSFLGFGDLYRPTWGTMVNFAYKRGAFLRRAYAYLLTPGVCIMLLSLSFYFISLWFEGRKDLIDE